MLFLILLACREGQWVRCRTNIIINILLLSSISVGSIALGGLHSVVEWIRIGWLAPWAFPIDSPLLDLISPLAHIIEQLTPDEYLVLLLF